MALELDPRYVFRDFKADGNPSSGLHNPMKPEIRALFYEWWQVIIALVADAGGVDLPNMVIRFEVTGGTANAIQATPDLPIPEEGGSPLFSIIIEQPNTGPVTVNGKPLRTNSGNEIPSGGLIADGVYLFLDNGEEYRLLSDYTTSAIAAAAEAAAQAAETAAQDAEQSRSLSESAANRAENAAAGVEFPVSYGLPQTLTPEQQEQARENIGIDAALDTFISVEPQVFTPAQQEQARANIGVASPRLTIQHVRTGTINYERIVFSGSRNILRKEPGLNFNPATGQFNRQGLGDYSRERGYRAIINCDADNPLGGGLYKKAGLDIFNGVAYQDFEPSDEWTQEAILMRRDGKLVPARYTDGKTPQDYVNEGALWSTGWGPLLVVDGVGQNISAFTVATQISARTVLGQRANGEYVILLIEGDTGAYGITGNDLVTLCLSEGLEIAMNLDGGGSTQCWWDTAYAHPSSDDEPRARGHHLVIDVPAVPTFDTGRILLPNAPAITGGQIYVSQVGDLISIEVSVTGSFPTTAYTELTQAFPKRFWPAVAGYGRQNSLVGSQYRPVSFGFPAPMSGTVYARGVHASESSISGTVLYKAKYRS